jgi:hypothetical protein
MLVASIVTDAEGDRLYIDCPGCGELHAPYISGDRSRHPVWEWNNNLERPTLSPSIRVRWTFGFDRQERMCHFFIVDGQIQFCADSTHALAGKTVPMLEWGK